MAKKSEAARAAIHVKPQRTITSQQARENTREVQKKWYEQKNRERGHHYDFSRKFLNFAVVKGKIKPLSEVKCKDVIDRFDNRLAALDWNYDAYKGKKIQPNTYLDWVFSGDHNVMNKLAFGDQQIDFDYKHADNSHLRRMPEIEAWAKDLYQFCCDKFGENNVCGVEVHLDETTVHAHVNVIPVGLRKVRGRAQTVYQSNDDPSVMLTAKEWKNLNSAKRKNYTKIVSDDRESIECVSYCGLMGDTKGQRGGYLKQFHTDYHEQVGSKYGLARGDYMETLDDAERRERNKHKTSTELEAETQAAIKEGQERLDAIYAKQKAEQAKLDEQKNEIKSNEETLASQNQNITKLTTKQQELQDSYDTLTTQHQELQNSYDNLQSQHEELQKVIAEDEKTIKESKSVMSRLGLKSKSDQEKEIAELKKKLTKAKADGKTEGVAEGEKNAISEILDAAELEAKESLTAKEAGEAIKSLLNDKDEAVENAEANVREKVKLEVAEDTIKAIMTAGNIKWKDRDGKPSIPTSEQLGKKYAEHRGKASKLKSTEMALETANTKLKEAKDRENALPKVLWDILRKMLPAPIFNCLLYIDRQIHSAASPFELGFKIIDNLLKALEGLSADARRETTSGIIDMERLLLGDWDVGKGKLDAMSRKMYDVVDNPDKYTQHQSQSQGRGL